VHHQAIKPKHNKKAGIAAGPFVSIDVACAYCPPFFDSLDALPSLALSEEAVDVSPLVNRTLPLTPCVRQLMQRTSTSNSSFAVDIFGAPQHYPTFGYLGPRLARHSLKTSTRA